MVAAIFDYDRYKRLLSLLKVFFSGFYGRIKLRDLICANVILEKRIIIICKLLLLPED